MHLEYGGQLDVDLGMAARGGEHPRPEDGQLLIPTPAWGRVHGVSLFDATP
jgi:hypothetical protein